MKQQNVAASLAATQPKDRLPLKELAKSVFRRMGYSVSRIEAETLDLERIHDEFREHTMIPRDLYLDNLRLARNVMALGGDIVECGVWRGGMIGGLGRLLGPGRVYHLFDSFQGLPDATEFDGEKAKEYQEDTSSPTYYDNCAASIDFAKLAMTKAGVPHVLHEGWFDQTLPEFAGQYKGQIALLRLDGDWYDSTWCCLENLYPLLSTRGVMIIDDYYYWDGCSKAVHDYLSKIKSASRVCRSPQGVAYIVKQD